MLKAASRVLSVIDPDKDHRKQFERTGFWGSRGAGSIVCAFDTRRILLPFRSRHVAEPNTWGTWGGAIDDREDPKEAATRELREEAGYSGKVKLLPLLLFKTKDFQYQNYLALVPHEFEPRLNWETQHCQWFEYPEWPQPVHPGLKALLKDRKSIRIIEQLITD